MKALLIPTLLISLNTAFGQTAQIEQSNIVKMFVEKKITFEQNQERGKKWRELMSQVQYPVLPYDSATNGVTFNAILDFNGLSKQVITSRILEWAAINFGSLEAVLKYRNDADGKLILGGYSNIQFLDSYSTLFGAEKTRVGTKKCNMTMVFTIKDSKAKIEFSEIEFEFTYFDGISIRSLNYSIDEIYPVTNQAPEKWRGSIDLLTQTVVFFNRMRQGIVLHVKNFKNDYEF